MANAISHDQNFKNLILDYPREALAFFAAGEAPSPEDDVRIVPVRQEQLQEVLGGRYRELDVPLLVEWTDGPPGGGAVRARGGVGRAAVLAAPVRTLLPGSGRAF